MKKDIKIITDLAETGKIGFAGIFAGIFCIIFTVVFAVIYYTKNKPE